MTRESSSQPGTKFVWFSAGTIFLGAFLLFQVQPIISRMILPWFGGGPAVWSTSMLFFQILLLGGYAYAHFLNKVSVPKWQMVIHVVLLVAAACTLPINPSEAWKPEDGSRPTWRILSLLLFNVGLPYFILSSTGPLVQAWFSRVYPGRSPYRLYALSNVGSLGALLTYPILFETWLTSSGQGRMWSWGFVAFGLLCGTLAYLVMRTAPSPEGNVSRPKQGVPAAPSIDDESAAPPAIEQRFAWLMLPALASVMLLAVTAHLCQDVAVIPFFWVIPLSLYLLSFIMSFDSTIWYRRRVFAVLLGLTVFWICFVMLDDDIENAVNKGIGFINDHVSAIEINYRMNLDGDYLGETLDAVNWFLSLFGVKKELTISDFAAESIAFLTMLFCLCMVCHGEVVRSKPPTRWLTEFYMMISAGGALGGIFVGLICPQVFSFNVEMSIGLIAGFMLAVGVVWDDLWQSVLLNRFWKKSVAFMWGFGLLLLVVRGQFNSYDVDAILMKRNFYGVLKVKDYYEGSQDHLRELLNGRILHGSQFQDPARSRMATTYYDVNSGVGLAATVLEKKGPVRVAVVGLGAGTMAAYSRAGDYFCFYEINPNVREIAYTQFTYVTETEAKVHVELGDARISMERQEPQNYDLIALDAFSGDAIPVHLLVKEAFDQYYRHLKPSGVIAVHISNRHLDLSPVVYGMSQHFKTAIVLVDHNDDSDSLGGASSEWILLTKNREILEAPEIMSVATPVELKNEIPLWTDQYSNLFQILK